MPTRSLACSVFALSPESWINAAYSSACVLSQISNVKHVIEVSLRLARVAVSQNNEWFTTYVTMSRPHSIVILISCLYKTLYVKYQPHAQVIMMVFDSFLPGFGLSRLCILELHSYLSCSLVIKLRFDHDTSFVEIWHLKCWKHFNENDILWNWMDIFFLLISGTS